MQLIGAGRVPLYLLKAWGTIRGTHMSSNIQTGFSSRRSARILAALLGLSLVAMTAGFAETPVPQTDQRNANSRLLAAAEPFEILTEQAFSATLSKLRSLVKKAEMAAKDARAALAADGQRALDQQLSAIVDAEGAKNRSELALAAVEGYRILVSSAGDTRVPVAVSLLDYAGFRYNADLKSNPVRWVDMQAAVEFAQEQWNAISGQVSQPSLQKSFTSALAQMGEAVAQKSAGAAATSVKNEQELVDKLEAYFTRK
jgi:hypothetical protein